MTISPLAQWILVIVITQAFALWLSYPVIRDNLKDLHRTRKCTVCESPAVIRVWGRIQKIQDDVSRAFEGRCEEHASDLIPLKTWDIWAKNFWWQFIAHLMFFVFGFFAGGVFYISAK